MDKFTLFELHVHDGMEFSATNTAPAIGGAAEEVAELAEYVDADDATDEADEASDEDAGESSRSLLPLVVAVVVLAVVAVAVRKFRGRDTELEIAELDDLVDEAETYEDADAEL